MERSQALKKVKAIFFLFLPVLGAIFLLTLPARATWDTGVCGTFPWWLVEFCSPGDKRIMWDGTLIEDCGSQGKICKQNEIDFKGSSCTLQKSECIAAPASPGPPSPPSPPPNCGPVYETRCSVAGYTNCRMEKTNHWIQSCKKYCPGTDYFCEDVQRDCGTCGGYDVVSGCWQEETLVCDTIYNCWPHQISCNTCNNCSECSGGVRSCNNGCGVSWTSSEGCSQPPLPPGKIVGRVFLDSDAACPAEGTPLPSISVTLSGGALASAVTILTDSTGYFEFGNLQAAGNFSLSLQPLSGYSPVCPLSGTAAFVGVAAGQSTVVNFSLQGFSSAQAWFQAQNGDMAANNSITSLVPSSTGGGFAGVLLDGGASGIVASGGGIDWGRGRLGPSGRNWKLTDHPLLPFPVFNLDLLRNRSLGSPVWANLVQNGVYVLRGPQTLSGEYRVAGGGVALVLVEGDLRFGGTGFRSADSPREGIIFLVTGNVVAQSDVEEIHAALVVVGTDGVGGVLRSETAGRGDDRRLIVYGLAVVEDHLELRRDRSALDGNLSPSEIFVFNPLYLASDLPFLSTSYSKWMEINP